MNRRDLRIALAEFEKSQADLAASLGRPAGRITAWVNADVMPGEVVLFIWIARNHSWGCAEEVMNDA